MPTTLTTQPIEASFFDPRPDTLLAWLGSAGVLINSRGTVLLIDPLITLEERESGPVIECLHHRLKIPLPISSDAVVRADAVLITHSDADHFGRLTAGVLNRRLAARFVAPPPVHDGLRAAGVPDERIVTARDFESVRIGGVQVVVTPALHDWNPDHPFRRGDCCGYLVRTPDGAIWHPGDTRLIEELLAIRDVAVLFFDAAQARAHLGPEGSARLAWSCGAKYIIPFHYGTFDVPPGGPFGGDPEDSRHLVESLPGKFLVLNPGQPFRLPASGQ